MTRVRSRRLLAAAGLALLVAPASAAEGWERVREQDGVLSFRGTGEGGLPAFRAETSIDANVLQVLAVLQDDTRRPEWMARCVDAFLIEQLGRWEFVSYNRLASVWPLSDRDVVVESTVTLDADGQRAVVAMRSIDSDVAFEGVRRIRSLAGQYRLAAEGQRRTGVQYELVLDVGSRLPTSILSPILEAIPFDTLRNLRSHVLRTRGDYAALVAEWSAELTNAAPHERSR